MLLSALPFLNFVTEKYNVNLTICIEQSMSWKANRYLASQEIPRICIIWTKTRKLKEMETTFRDVAGKWY